MVLPLGAEVKSTRKKLLREVGKLPELWNLLFSLPTPQREMSKKRRLKIDYANLQLKVPAVIVVVVAVGWFMSDKAVLLGEHLGEPKAPRLYRSTVTTGWPDQVGSGDIDALAYVMQTLQVPSWLPMEGLGGNFISAVGLRLWTLLFFSKQLFYDFNMVFVHGFDFCRFLVYDFDMILMWFFHGRILCIFFDFGSAHFHKFSPIFS